MRDDAIGEAATVAAVAAAAAASVIRVGDGDGGIGLRVGVDDGGVSVNVGDELPSWSAGHRQSRRPHARVWRGSSSDSVGFGMGVSDVGVRALASERICPPLLETATT